MLKRTVNILTRQGDLLEDFSLYVLLDNLSPYIVFIGSFHWFGWRSSESQLQFVCIHMNIP